MKIILAQIAPDGKASAEHALEKQVILIGRDEDCDLALDKARFPMVSRRHAELRWHDGNWILSDLGSSYGTFLNEQRIDRPVTIAAGSRIRIGQDGPVVLVVWFEVGELNAVPTPAAEVRRKEAVRIEPASRPAEQQQRPVHAAPRSALIPEPGGTPFALSQDPIWIGRDPACEVVIEASAVMVSRRHAQVARADGGYQIVDNNSFNGTLVNGQRISSPTPLYHGDEVQFGLGGPTMRFDSPGQQPPAAAILAGQRSVSIHQLPPDAASVPVSSKTMVFQLDKVDRSAAASEELLMTLVFGSKDELSIGRGEGNDIRLDGLQISNRHARLLRSGDEVVIDDLGSTNGVFVNGARVSRHSISTGDVVQVGSFVLRVDNAGNIGVFDTRSKTRIDAVNLTREVRGGFGRARLTLLDSISLSIRPNEFVGLLGPSGCGKTSLIDALNGVRPARGNVLINNLDLYSHFDSLKHSIGYVPQDDVIHRELTVYRTLYYTARLRLSRDVSRAEIDQTINEILDVTGLAERRNVRVDRLSGGQRKRVSMAVELITKPSVIFLDEPTSGLDPATEEKVMKLFRQIAESGRTVIMTTHAMENVRLFDKVVLMLRGRLVFYGTPPEALSYFGAATFKELYNKLDEPVERAIRQQGEAARPQATEQAANEWKEKYLASREYRANIHEPLASLGSLQQAGIQKKRRLGILGAVRQWLTLSVRYIDVLAKDKLNLAILLIQAPIIAFMTYLVMGGDLARDFVYFVLSLVAIWFGTSVAAREIIRERPIFRRERMVNLGILPYVVSKLFVLGMIVTLQCLLIFVPLKTLDLAGLMPMPGEFLGLPQLWAMLLTAGVGLALGLLVSTLVRTSEMATSLVPLILIPQILFSGLVGVPTGLSRAVGLAMPAAWSFDTMKRFSTLDTIEPEGAAPNGPTRGLGLLKYIETENEKIIVDARRSIDNYKKDAENKFRQYDDEVRSGRDPALPDVGEPPPIPEARKVPDDLSSYVTFLHPWMVNEVLNQLVLMLMFGILVLTVLIVLRLQDIG